MADSQNYKIGYALTPEDESSFIQDSLLNRARNRGIDFIRIDMDKALVDQGPFDCILQMASGGDEWKCQLDQYASRNPNVLVIESREANKRLHTRSSMLQLVSEMKIPQYKQTFGIPNQIAIYKAETLADACAWSDLKFPVIAKPLVADGSAESRKMSLVYNSDGLSKLKPPLVLQEFVNHGGIIFRVYVAGNHVKCVKRKSLPDVTEGELNSLEGSLSFSRDSSMTQDHTDKYYQIMDLEDAEIPTLNFITAIGRGLRQALGLQLFNFDVVRDVRIRNHYLVIDINYFSGFANMASNEAVLNNFFWDIFQRRPTEKLFVTEDAVTKCSSDQHGVENRIDDDGPLEMNLPIPSPRREEEENTLED